jgi:hypothetical protein
LIAAIKIGDHGFKQISALGQALGEGLPIVGGLDHRHRAERPVAWARRLAIVTDEDAGIAQILGAAGKSALPVVRIEALQMVDQISPRRPYSAIAVQ